MTITTNIFEATIIISTDLFWSPKRNTTGSLETGPENEPGNGPGNGHVNNQNQGQGDQNRQTRGNEFEHHLIDRLNRIEERLQTSKFCGRIAETEARRECYRTKRDELRQQRLEKKNDQLPLEQAP